MKNLESLEFDPRVFRRRAGPPDPQGECVVYWMQRSQRANDNPALNLAIEAGNLLTKPVVVFFQLVPRARHANLRHYEFMRCGLEELPAGLRKRAVGFVLRRYPEHGLLRFCSEVKPCLVIGDENPLREAELRKDRIAAKLPAPFWTVDSDVIVPTRLLGREHYAARTIRPKIQALLPKFLKPLKNLSARVPWRHPGGLHSLESGVESLEKLSLDRSTAPVSTYIGGSAAAHRALARFLRGRLAGYAARRNKPEIDGTSQLSPYLHFGHLGPHAVATAVREAAAPAADRKAFLEELIVRRELAVNFVRYNRNYDCCDASEPWAARSLRQHAGDTRKASYTERQLEGAALYGEAFLCAFAHFGLGR